MEWTLQQQGFDHCYDKRLYDRLVARGPPSRCAGTCRPTLAYQERLLRFIENHDEPRAAGHVRPGAGARRGGGDRPRCRARGCSTTASSTGTACASRCSSARGPGRAARRRPARVLRAAAARGRRLRPARRRLAPVRLQRLAGQRLVPAARGLVLARAAWSWSTSPTRRRRRGCDCRGTDLAGRRLGAHRPARGASASSAPATSSPPRASTSDWAHGAAISSRSGSRACAGTPPTHVHATLPRRLAHRGSSATHTTRGYTRWFLQRIIRS